MGKPKKGPMITPTPEMIVKGAEEDHESRDISDLVPSIIGSKITFLEFYKTDLGNYVEIWSDSGSAILFATADISVLERKYVDSNGVN